MECRYKIARNMHRTINTLKFRECSITQSDYPMNNDKALQIQPGHKVTLIAKDMEIMVMIK